MSSTATVIFTKHYFREDIKYYYVQRQENTILEELKEHKDTKLLHQLCITHKLLWPHLTLILLWESSWVSISKHRKREKPIIFLKMVELTTSKQEHLRCDSTIFSNHLRWIDHFYGWIGWMGRLGRIEQVGLMGWTELMGWMRRMGEMGQMRRWYFCIRNGIHGPKLAHFG